MLIIIIIDLKLIINYIYTVVYSSIQLTLMKIIMYIQERAYNYDYIVMKNYISNLEY